MDVRTLWRQNVQDYCSKVRNDSVLLGSKLFQLSAPVSRTLHWKYKTQVDKELIHREEAWYMPVQQSLDVWKADNM